ncbi:MAG: DUF937 domain-containing protein [Planctomycetales bacterium]|nr:DUF937 domain-containing protein [Planctomycetales bacterium]
MSSLLEMLGGQLAGGGSAAIARQLGVDQKQAETAIGAALPTLLEALQRRAEQPETAAGLNKALENDHDGSLLDNLAGYLERGEGGARAVAGDRILGHLLGERQDRVANGIAGIAGLNATQSMKLMAMLAPMLMGALGRRKREQNLGQGQLSDILRQENDAFRQGDSAQASIFGRLLDQDGDGDFDAKDMMKLGASMIGRMFKR